VGSEKPDVLALQETKLEVVTESLIYGLWGNDDCDWSYVPAVGNSGGILSIWRKSLFLPVFSFSGCGFVGVCLEVIQDQCRCYVVNVYAKCNLNDKRRLWGEILNCKQGFGGGCWCVVGDFNSVRDNVERKGIRPGVSQSQSREVVEFDQFLEDLELVDMPLLGRRFTWFHPNGVSMSRLDRILLSEDWLIKWTNPSVWALARDVSDHCPLVIRYNSEDWGPKPFRFNNFWLQHKSFRDLVIQTWEQQ
jgi:hypothetical protein